MNKTELFKCFEQESLIQIIQESPVWYLEKDDILFEEGGEEQNSMYIILRPGGYQKPATRWEWPGVERCGPWGAIEYTSPGDKLSPVSFSMAYGFPVFGGPDPSDGSFRTLYLNGMVSF